MMSTAVSNVELELADSIPFGRHSYISGEVSKVYAKLLAALAPSHASAGKLLGELDGAGPDARGVVFRDPLLRRTIEDGICQALQGLNTIEPEVFDLLLTRATEIYVRFKQPLLSENRDCVLLNRDFGYGYAWVEDRSDHASSRRFTDEVLKRMPGFQINPTTPEQMTVLTEAVSLAQKITPHLAQSALAHAQVVIVGEFTNGLRINSLTMPGLPGVIVLSPKVVASSAEASEALLHESLHLKFLDIDYIHPLFATGFRQETSPKITPVWHSDKPQNGNWPIDRLLTSMHVYLGLAVFHRKAGILGVEGDGVEDRLARSEQCEFRANWLFDAVQDHPQHLSAKGKEFVSWIGELLARLDSAKELTNHRRSYG